MLRSLRFRLPALFLAGIVVSGLVAAVVAFQLFQSYTLKRAKDELRREAAGVTRLYVAQANSSNDPVPAPQLEHATGDHIYYVPPGPGFDLFPGNRTAHLRTLPRVRGGDEIGHLADRFREMAARLSEAEQQERNFLMSVSHELRTPLTAIRGHVDALREGVAEDPAVRAASLDVIASETARLDRLVGDVLDLAKLEAHRFTLLREEVDMEPLCDHAYTASGEEARPPGTDYPRRFDPPPPIVSDGD